jgi:hypothetical protein
VRVLDETVPVSLSSRTLRLTGRRGWGTATVLALSLVMLVGGHAVSGEANAEGHSAAPSTAAPSLVPVSARTALDRPVPAPPAPPVPAPAPPSAPAPPVEVVPAAAPAPAPAPADLCSGEGWQQRRGEAALASLAAGAERTGFSVTFAPARKGYMGLTHLQERRIEVFVRGCDVQSDELLRHVMAHELGHAYDTTHGNDGVRAAYQAARGIPASTPWYGCSGCTDFATPAGDFAEVYAQWVRGSADNRSELAGDPGPAELAALAAQFFGG